jgi:integrase
MTHHLRLKFVQAFVDRKTGAVFRYFRRPGFPRVRLPGLPGSREFNEAYQAALEGPYVEIGAKRSKPGSVSMVVAAYFGSNDFSGLAAGTRAMRRQILERFREAHGDKPIALLPSKFVALTLSQMKPFAAHNWLKALRGLMAYAVKLQIREDDPTRGVKLARVKSDGVHTWTEGEIEQYAAVHPIGSKARLALALGIYTGQRRGDAIRMGRQHIRDGVLSVRQDKTGVELAIPVHADLAAIIAATPGEHLTFLVSKRGTVYTGNAFTRMFHTWCAEAGLPEACSFHGLRKAACRRLAEAGASTNEIAAISGHASLREVERYTKAADQARMARNAMARTFEQQNTVKLDRDLTIVGAKSLKTR